MKPVHLDPRTKLFLIPLCVLNAMFAPNLYFQFALVILIGCLAACCGNWRYALRGILAYGLICVFTIWCMGVMSGTWRAMFVAVLGLVHKGYACGMLAGLVISTTRVGEFHSTMTRLRVPKKLTIPFAVMLRYLPTIREDWHFIKDSMRLRDVSPTLWGFLKAPAMTVNCIYVPLLTAASKAADELSIASVTRGIENPNSFRDAACRQDPVPPEDGCFSSGYMDPSARWHSGSCTGHAGTCSYMDVRYESEQHEQRDCDLVYCGCKL